MLWDVLSYGWNAIHGVILLLESTCFQNFPLCQVAPMQEAQGMQLQSLGLGQSPGEGNGNSLQYFLSGKFHGQRHLEGYKSTGSQSWTRQGHSRGTSTLSGISPESPQDGDPEVTVEFLAPGVYRISFLIPSYASDPPNTALLDNSPLKGTGIPTCSQVKKTFHFLVSFCLMAVRHVRSSLPAQGLSRPPLH